MTQPRERVKTQWQAREIEVLLDAIEQRPVLRVYLRDRADMISTGLVGFDLDKGELLLDTPHAISVYELARLIERRETLTLAINAGPDTWFLECALNALERNLVSVFPTNMRKVTGRRLHPRMYFASGERPSAQVRAAWSPLLRGELLDLSPFGCQLHIAGADVRRHFAEREAQVSLYFNEEFQFSCHSEVKQLQFLRKPCCHNKVRLIFKAVTPLQVEQLQTFIQSFVFASAA